MQLPADATLEQAAALAAQLPQALANDSSGGSGDPGGPGEKGVWRIDASALQRFDSATIALLMQAGRLAAAAGRGFAVSGAPPKLAQLARLYGVEELLALQGSAQG